MPRAARRRLRHATYHFLIIRHISLYDAMLAIIFRLPRCGAIFRHASRHALMLGRLDMQVQQMLQRGRHAIFAKFDYFQKW